MENNYHAFYISRFFIILSVKSQFDSSGCRIFAETIYTTKHSRYVKKRLGFIIANLMRMNTVNLKQNTT